jgi:hypothetical protein
MPYIDWKKLKERVSLRDILDHYGLADGLTETLHGFGGECPFCGSNAFKANTEKNAWFCFGECKAKAKETEGHNGGNILDFVARMEDVSVKKAAELISEWFLEYPAPATTRKVGSVPRSQSREAHTEEPKERAEFSTSQEPEGDQTQEGPRNRGRGGGERGRRHARLSRGSYRPFESTACLHIAEHCG